MNRDYAATSTGVGTHKMPDCREQTQRVFNWSVFDFLIWPKLHLQDKSVCACFFSQVVLSLEERRLCLPSGYKQGLSMLLERRRSEK